MSEFENSVRNGVVIRDKVGNVGRSDDQTLFGNESNLPQKEHLLTIFFAEITR